MSGVDPREMAKSDVIVIWGTNAVATQVNVMTHATRARKERGAKIVVDRHLRHRDDAPGRSRAAAEARHRRRARLRGHARRCSATGSPTATTWRATPTRPRRSRRISQTRDAAMGERDHRPCRSQQIEEFAALVGRNKRSFFRLGYGFSRQRNGAANMHAALCVPAVTGAWAHEGGGALHSNSGVYKLDKTLIEGLDARDRSRPAARSVARRRDPDRRRGGAEGRRPGQGDADPEHQSDGRRARPGEGAARLRPRRPVRLRARAVHDRHRALRRHRAAGDDVPRARRPLHRRRPPVSAVRRRRRSSRRRAAAPTTR